MTLLHLLTHLDAAHKCCPHMAYLFSKLFQDGSPLMSMSMSFIYFVHP